MASGYEGEGGIGGKFRRRPFRKSTAASTPYDRPPTADRALRLNGRRNGWISKLVDPASRLIASGASMFFNSVFTKRLPPAPTPTPTPTTTADAPSSASAEDAKEPDAELRARENASNAVHMNPPQNMPDGGAHTDCSIDKTDGSSVIELEQLLKQKTFTRVEFDHLTKLLRSRTLDLPMEDETKRSEPNTSETPIILEKKQVDVLPQQNGILKPTANNNVSDEEIASPTELAKAYMDSRASNMSPTTSGLRYPAHRDMSNLSAAGQTMVQSSNGLVAPRSSVRFSGLGENSYRTPIPHGRSAIYRMSRSPYFKSQPMIPSQGRGTDGEVNTSHISSLQAPSLVSGSKQVLKRRSTFVENDSGSYGPIRRIRQKSDMVSPLKHNVSSGRRFLPQPANSLQNSGLSVSKSALSSGPNKHISVKLDDIDGMNKTSHECFSSIPKQSSSMARKILEQLDHLVPSPKEKVSPAQLAITGAESPSKLTFNMLNGQALNSVKDIDSSKLYVANSQNINVSSGFFESGIIEKNGPSKATTSGVKIFSEGVPRSDKKYDVSFKNKYSVAAASADPVFSRDPPVKKPSFSMQAPESSWEMENDNVSGGDASDRKTMAEEMTKTSITQTNDFERKSSDNGFNFSKPSLPASTIEKSSLSKEEFMMISASKKAQDFSPSGHGTEQTSVSSSKDQLSAPLFSFGSKRVPTIAFPSSSSANDSSSLKFGVKSDSQIEAPGRQTDVLGVGKGKEADILGQTSTTGSVIASLNKPAFGTLVTSSPSNGLPKMMTSGPVSTSSATPLSGLVAAPQISESASVLALPSVKSSQKISGFKALSTESIATTVNKSNTEDLETKAKGSLFGQQKFSAPADAPSFSSSSSSLFGFSFSTPSTDSSSAPGKLVTTQPSQFAPQFGNGASIFTQGSTSQFGSFSSASTPVTGDSGVSSSGSAFGSYMSGIKPFSFDSNSESGQFKANATSTSSSSSSLMSTKLFSSSQSSSSSIFTSGSSSVSQSSGFSFGGTSAPILASSTSVSGFSFGATSAPTSASSTSGSLSSGFSFGGTSAPTSASSTSGSLSSGFSFGGTSAPTSASSTSASLSSGFSFGATSASSTSGSLSTGFSFGATSTPASASSTSGPFSFGSASPVSSSVPSMPFGATSAPAFAFTSAAANATPTFFSPPQAGFGVPSPAFGTSTAGNEHMCVEDSMTDDTVQTAMPVSPPVFGQAITPSTQPMGFGSPVQPTGTMGFQFGGQPTPPAFPQAQTAYQAPGSLDFAAGGSFSLGSGGGDKSNRRIVKVKRTKPGGRK